MPNDLNALAQRLRNVTTRQVINALLSDGFERRRRNPDVYKHPDGRMAVIHPHRGGDTFPAGTLKSVLQGVRWTEDDARRLGLLE